MRAYAKSDRCRPVWALRELPREAVGGRALLREHSTQPPRHLRVCRRMATAGYAAQRAHCATRRAAAGRSTSQSLRGGRRVSAERQPRDAALDLLHELYLIAEMRQEAHRPVGRLGLGRR